MLNTAVKLSRAEENAIGHAESIAALVAALETDFDRIEELEGIDAEDLTEDDKVEMAELIAAITIDGERMEDSDAVSERIQEYPLEVAVRSGWIPIADDMTAEEFCILLSTGGPACRIMGTLNQHSEPERVWIEYQDWGTPWTECLDRRVDMDALLSFASRFCFGN